MSKSKPPVIFKIKNFQKNQEVRERMFDYYYSGKKQGLNKNGSRKKTYLEYIMRDDAAFKKNISYYKMRELLFLKQDNPKLYDAEVKKINEDEDQNSGLWTKNGIASVEEIKELEVKMQRLDSKKQHFWDSVISFDSDFVEKYEINHPEMIHTILKDRINQLFKSKNMNPEQMEWGFSFHTNTDNPHIHLFFFESEATRKNNKFEWKYNFNQKSIDAFKVNFARDTIFLAKNFEISRIRDSRDKLVEKFKEELKNPLKFYDTSWNAVKQVYDSFKINYTKILEELNTAKEKISHKKQKDLYYWDLNDSQRKVIDNITSHLIQNDKEINIMYDNYYKNLVIYQDATNEVKSEVSDNFVKTSLYGKDGLYSRIGNKILNSMKRRNDLEKQTPFIPEYLSKLPKIEISLVDSLLSGIKKIIRQMNKLVEADKQNTIKFLKELNK